MNTIENLRNHLLISLLLVLVTLAAFSPVLRSGFTNYDDPMFVTQNPYVQAGLCRSSVAWAFTTTYTGNWHPLTWLSHMLDVRVFAAKPAGHHLTSLVLHVANVLLLFLVLLRLTGGLSDNPESGIRNPKWARCALVAALFAIHPLRVESVAWIAERKDVLSTFFLLLTIAAYARYAEKPGIIRYLPVIGLFALGLMSKPMLVTLPLVLLLLDYWPLGRFSVQQQPAAGTNTDHPAPNTGGSTSRIRSNGKRLLAEKIPLFVLSMIAAGMAVATQKSVGSASFLETLPLSARLANAANTSILYILKMLWPARLAVFYPHSGTAVSLWKTLGSVLALIAITALVFRHARKRRYLAVGWLWYLITLLPVIGLVQVGAQSMADRYTYVPLIGLFVVVAWGVPDLLSGRKEEREKGGATWRHGDAETRGGEEAQTSNIEPTSAKAMAGKLRTRDIRNLKPVTPRSDRPLAPSSSLPLGIVACAIVIALSVVTWRQTGYWKDSETLFRHALAVTSMNPVAHNNLGLALSDKGQDDEAIVHFREALKALAACHEARSNLASTLASTGRAEEAIAVYLEILDLNPDDAAAHGDLGLVLAGQGRLDDAVLHYEEALRISPDSADVRYNLGNAFAAQGKVSDAMECYRQVVNAMPGHAEAHFRLAGTYAKQGKTDKAIEELEEAVRLKPSDINMRAVLAGALMSRGRMAEAVSEYEAIVKIKPDMAAAHNNMAVALFFMKEFRRAKDELALARKYGAKPNPGFAKALEQAEGQSSVTSHQ